MSTDPAGPRRLRCALFVDFDNVYIGLQRLDAAAAEAFATTPAHWLAALATADDEQDGPLARRFLVRACYLNPSRFAQFRPNFTRAGFSVVDCPSLTQQGKSSADINLVLDAVDALAASTHYDEFVIVSADADFTPLALRCRAADRRVTIVTASPAASAYRAVADQVVTADELVDLLGGATAAAVAGTEPAEAAEARRRRTAQPAAAPNGAAASGEEATGTDGPALQRQVVEVTDVPNLPAERYQVLLTALAADLASAPFERVETARRVHEACQAAGEPIGRSSVNAVIAGVLYSGLDLSTRPDAGRIAATWADYVVGLVRGARMEPGPDEVAAIRDWVGGTLVAPPTARRRPRRARSTS